MEKRGQVTIFIVLAIFIVGIIMLLLLIPKNIEKPSEPNINNVYSYVHDLIENEAFKCLQQIGEQGGYYKIPNQIYVNETAYWYYEGVNTQPFLNTIENQTEECINKILRNSTENPLRIFGNDFIKISEDEIKSKVRINEWRTAIEVDYPIAISKGSSTSLISDFKVDYRINLLKLYELATGIVNYASLPDFDKCNPSNNCFGEDINFSFFNEGEKLFIKGQTFVIFSNKTKGEPYELRFAVKRPIKEAFGTNKKRMAILYEDDSDYRNFGSRALEIFENVEMVDGVDYYDCEGVSEFISKIDDYDIIVITGGLQYQIRKSSIFNSVTGKNEDSYSDSVGDLISGCNEFESSKRKIILKNWINRGGLLWINGVGKLEADNYEISYLGSLGYTSIGWQWEITSLDKIEEGMLKVIEEARYIIAKKDVLQKTNYLLTCPNNISEKIAGTWGSYKITITDKDEIIIGNKNNPSLWTRKLGNGEIVFDNFILNDRGYEMLGYNDDLYSKGLAEKYFVNVLNYLTKFKNYEKAELEISLISPLNDNEIESPVFYFQSEFGKNASYTFLITDKAGTIKYLILENQDIKEERFSRNRFKVDLTNKSAWTDLPEERYEWQIKMGEYFSDIGTFIKKIAIPINETQGGNETNGNWTI